MKIWTLWRRDENDTDTMPWIVSSYDEYTAEEHDGVPYFYANERQDGDRELIVEVPDEAVRALFMPPTVKAKVAK